MPLPPFPLSPSPPVPISALLLCPCLPVPLLFLQLFHDPLLRREPGRLDVYSAGVQRGRPQHIAVHLCRALVPAASSNLWQVHQLIDKAATNSDLLCDMLVNMPAVPDDFESELLKDLITE
eukprot:159891-Chlamydomonas_euryale.AAC.1